jgi:hypothetical protein
MSVGRTLIGATLIALLALGCSVDQVVGLTVPDGGGSPDGGPALCTDYSCTPACAGLKDCEATCDASGNCSFRCEGTCTPTCSSGSCTLECAAPESGHVDCQLVCSGDQVCSVRSCHDDQCTVDCGPSVQPDGGCP